MAMFEEFGLRTSELQDAFQKAAREGNKYLLVLEHVLGSEWLITSSEYTRAVKEAGDIVPLLRQLNPRPGHDDKHRLSAVYDLSKNFNQQGAVRPDYKASLPQQALNEIEQYKKSFDLSLRQRAWDQKPFLGKLFSSRPS